MFWLGLVIAIAGIAATAIFGVQAGQTLSSGFGDAGAMPNGSTTVTMAEGELRTIYGASAQDTDSATCEVTDPDGQAVPVQPATDFGDFEDVSLMEVGSFESTSPGAYQVDCSGGATLMGPAVDGGALTTGIFGTLAGLAGVGLGGLLLLIGAVLWFIGRSKAKKAAQSNSYGSGGGYGGPTQSGYNQGGYGSASPPPGTNQQPPSTNPYQSGSGSTPPPPPPSGY